MQIKKVNTNSSNKIFQTQSKAITFVIHYQLPSTQETNTHRNGRTSRYGKSGEVIYFYNSDKSIIDYLPENMSEFTRKNTKERQSNFTVKLLFSIQKV